MRHYRDKARDNMKFIRCRNWAGEIDVSACQYSIGATPTGVSEARALPCGDSSPAVATFTPPHDPPVRTSAGVQNDEMLASAVGTHQPALLLPVFPSRFGHRLLFR